MTPTDYIARNPPAPVMGAAGFGNVPWLYFGRGRGIVPMLVQCQCKLDTDDLRAVSLTRQIIEGRAYWLGKCADCGSAIWAD